MSKTIPQSYKKFFGGVPQAIFVFSAGVKKIKSASGGFNWVPTDYRDCDSFGVLGGRDRFEAAGRLGFYFPGIFFVSTSRPLGITKPGQPTHARVGARFLRELGVKSKRIILEERSVNLATQIKEMIKLTKRKKWKRVGIITSGFQIPRALAMYKGEVLRYLRPRGGQVIFVSSDEILSNGDPAYSAVLRSLRKRLAWTKRVMAEKRGISAIVQGRYHPANEALKTVRKEE